MTRSIRIEFSGAYFHVMARGNRREAIFMDDDTGASSATRSLRLVRAPDGGRPWRECQGWRITFRRIQFLPVAEKGAEKVCTGPVWESAMGDQLMRLVETSAP